MTNLFRLLVLSFSSSLYLSSLLFVFTILFFNSSKTILFLLDSSLNSLKKTLSQLSVWFRLWQKYSTSLMTFSISVKMILIEQHRATFLASSVYPSNFATTKTPNGIIGSLKYV
ncbi:14838_t:CDS:1 [Dentiscutata erythropus]|uniref:14838_t:CDS:1 n=1 Tax=Dentiscutata erythropus TaxID=1348616 RepID=A0A9N8ZJT1_9GLOM|nr:14838_t:CDS:1 [Dentiscutata erythropus]